MTYHDLNQSEHSLDGRRPMRVEQSVTRSTTASNLTLSLSGSTIRGLDWDVWLSGHSRQFLRGERCLFTTDMTRTRLLSGTLNYSNKQSNILTIFMVWSMCIEQIVHIQYIILKQLSSIFSLNKSRGRLYYILFIFSVSIIFSVIENDVKGSLIWWEEQQISSGCFIVVWTMDCQPSQA